MRSSAVDTCAVLINDLRAHLADRRIHAGYETIDAHRSLIAALTSDQPQAAAVVGYLAQWVNAGYASPGFIEDLLARFPCELHSRLTVEEYVHLRMSHGMLQMAQEEPGAAIDHFNVVLALVPDISDLEVVAIAHFWKARCLRRKGEYEKALAGTIVARDIVDSLGYAPMAALIRTQEAWLNFQKGKLREALNILSEAEAVLTRTDDQLTLGNIQSAYGRMSRREGRYEASVRHFRSSIEHYRRHAAKHPHIARSLANMAYVERLLSLRVRKLIDLRAQRRGKSGLTPDGTAELRQRYEELRCEAMAHLREAGEIYSTHLQQHGAGTVKVNCGFLYLDAGELDSASKEASEAFELGQQKNDSILMARARLLQCTIENAKLEEGIEESEIPGEHANAALDYARQAVEFAQNTENERLLARAQMWLGLTYCNEVLNDIEAARACCDAAFNMLKPDPHDPLWRELQSFRAKIVRAGSVDATLRAWSQGQVGNKTFQQITEEFAELIIPKVWEQEERKVARVATRLSISPKKVRRILARAGLLQPPAPSHEPR